MRRMHQSFRDVCKVLRKMPAEKRRKALPYSFQYSETVPALGDEPAAEQRVLLRVTTRAELLRELAEDGVEASISSRAPGGTAAVPGDEDEFLLEYVDTVPTRAGAPVRPLWLVEVVRSCFNLNPAYLPPADLRRRRSMLSQLRLGPGVRAPAPRDGEGRAVEPRGPAQPV